MEEKTYHTPEILWLSFDRHGAAWRERRDVQNRLREKRDKERIHGEVEDGAKRRDELAREGAWRLLVESHFKNGGG